MGNNEKIFGFVILGCLLVTQIALWCMYPLESLLAWGYVVHKIIKLN